ncbi:MAG: PIG-L family deacetylase [Alphaproteobacteria bacterium]
MPLTSPSALVADYLRLLGMKGQPSLPNVSGAGGTCAIFAPHPDDESITTGLALRLRREAGMKVVNIPVTLGSNTGRREERKQELQKACELLGFEIVEPAAQCFDQVKPDTKTAQPIFWDGMAAKLGALLERIKPDILFLPHRGDAHPTHVGTHDLVMDALAKLPAEFSTILVFTEYWQPQILPNLMVESPADDVALLIEALQCHAGEIARNPYHRSLPAWMIDNARRGAEVVGGLGTEAGHIAFATLYQFGVWRGGRYETAPVTMILPASHSAASLMAAAA